MGWRREWWFLELLQLTLKVAAGFWMPERKRTRKFSFGTAYSVPPLITDTAANTSTFRLQTARSLLHLLIAPALKEFKACVWHPCGQPPGLRLGYKVSSTQSCLTLRPWVTSPWERDWWWDRCRDKTDVWENYIRAGFLMHCEQLNANKP